MNIQDIIAMIMGRLPQQSQAANPLQQLLQRFQGGMPGQGAGRPAWAGQSPVPPTPSTVTTAAPPSPGGVPASPPAPQGNAFGQRFKAQFGSPPGQMRDQFQDFKTANRVKGPGL